MTRIASIKETGEEISQADWERFDAAVAQEKARRTTTAPVVQIEPTAETEPTVEIHE